MHIKSSLIELNSALIELKSALFELKSSVIELESSLIQLNIWVSVNLAFHILVYEWSKWVEWEVSEPS